MKKWLKITLALVVVAAAAGVASVVRFDVPVVMLMPKYADSTSKFVKVDGMVVHYRDAGQGMPLVLLHGVPSALQDWDGWTKALSGKFRVIRLDLPGYGLTGPNPSGDYSMQFYAGFLDRFLDAVNVKEIYLAGNSYGGRISCEYAFEHGDRVKKLILVDSSGYPDKGQPLEVEKLAHSAPGRLLLRYISSRSMIEKNLRQVYRQNPGVVTPQLIDRFYELLLRAGNRETFIKLYSSPREDLSDRIKAIRVPTLILWGKEDTTIPVEDAYKFEKDIPGAKLVLYEHVGHIPQMEIPEKSAADAAQFLSGK